MAYQLEKGEPLLKGIYRIGKEEQKATLAALSTIEDPHKGIHQARKHLKKLRALIRLIRDQLGRNSYKDGNIYYRDIGRHLAALRDITSLIEISIQLQEQYAQIIGHEGFEHLLQLLTQERKRIQKEKPQKQLFKKEVQLIKKDKTRFTKPSKPVYSIENALKSLTRVYKRGVRGFQKAQILPEAEGMHDWRKRVKYLWHHFQLIEQAWPALMICYIEILKNLADELGDYHDLALLQEKTQLLKKNLPEGFAKKLWKIAEKEKKNKLSEALNLGQLIYAERPKAFRRRMAVIIKCFK